MSDNKKHSYTSASTIPAKIITNPWLIAETRAKGIPPYHPQLIPTNQCNLKCGFCSCKKRDKTLLLSYEQIMSAMLDFKKLGGARAVTITGGGDPLCHPDIVNIIRDIRQKVGAEVGLVTNGIWLSQAEACIDSLKWCRISASDEGNRISGIEKYVKNNPHVDWAISYVLTAKADVNNIASYVDFCNAHSQVTHMRIVSDLLDTDRVPFMEEIEENLKSRGIFTNKVVLQGKKDWWAGNAICQIGLLKPLVGADGYVYPCCGVQYAHNVPDEDLPANMRLCSIQDITKTWQKQVPFNGSRCTKCYYRDYNDVLDIMRSDIDHQFFV
jgi:MoaA/NifB/PqqE/SkfB family radical SAM enzyme